MTINESRVIPDKYWRRIAIVLIVLLAVVALLIVIAFIYILATIPIPNFQSRDTPEWITKIVVPIFRDYSKLILGVISSVGVAFIVLISFIAIQFVRADKVKIFWVEFSISDELTTVRKSLDDEIERSVSLTENVREIQALIGQQTFFLSPTKDKYFDYLDEIVSTAGFIVRPQGRAVRASIWLAKKTDRKMKMVAGYRISKKALESFRLDLNGDGFAPLVLRAGRPQIRDNPTVGGEWALSPDNTPPTTSIMGQGIQIGNDDNWQAVLCFSTDRDISRFPQYKFSLEADATTLNFFSDMISVALTLAKSINVPQSGGSTRPLIEIIYERYG